MKNHFNKMTKEQFNSLKPKDHKTQLLKFREKQEPVKIHYTNGFLNFLKEDSIIDQNVFTMQDMYEIYINYIVWDDLEKDVDIPKSHLKIRQ